MFHEETLWEAVDEEELWSLKRQQRLMPPEVDLSVMDTEECRCDVPILKPKIESHVRGNCTPRTYPYQALSSNNNSIRLLKNLSFKDPTHRRGEDMFKGIK